LRAYYRIIINDSRRHWIIILLLFGVLRWRLMCGWFVWLLFNLWLFLFARFRWWFDCTHWIF
jgi:hypothetical protein